ncbi:MAG: hypothetical protein HKN23_07540 [Verrucomicrobiales bacterium]|nr:hypothetical protein [Verrucomicrobiales bacterium]
MKWIPALLFALAAPFCTAAEPIDLGDRLELFTDNYLLAGTDGDVEQVLILPEPKDVVITCDDAWEGNTSGYFGLFEDGDEFKMIYRGWRHDPETKKELQDEVTCLAVSKNGLKFTKPNLGVREFKGSKENNIIWNGGGSHNFFGFLDTNPEAKPEGKYKALAGMKGGLVPLQSTDAVNWKKIVDKAVITNGAFDSQNLAFYDNHRGEYRAYWRYFSKTGFRAIRTATSKDFVNWEKEEDLKYTEGTPEQHLYTNAVQPYFRAPHLFIGFPTRYLPGEGQRVEPILMTSRDGVLFHRWNDPVVPESAPEDRKGNRSNYMTWGILQLPGKPDEISVYATESYYGPKPGRVRRFVYRTDGFVALRGGKNGGNATTKFLRTDEDQLLVNYVANKGGSLVIEALDAGGNRFSTSKPLTGDSTAAKVEWEKPVDFKIGVKLRFSLTNADLYSIKFE